MTLLLQNTNIELIIPYIFIGFIALPLPILLLHGITTSALQEVRDRVRYRNVKKHYNNIELLTMPQLIQLYPAKNEEILEGMMDALTDRSYNIKYKIETQFKKKHEKLFEVIQRFQSEKVQVYSTALIPNI